MIQFNLCSTHVNTFFYYGSPFSLRKLNIILFPGTLEHEESKILRVQLEMEKAAEDKISISYSLQDMYDDNPQQIEEEYIPKYIVISQRFEEIYGIKPDFFSRAPSKVTLLGDHINFYGYSTISAAIEQDVIIAFKESSDPYIEIHNFIENLYRHIKIPVDGNMKPLEDNNDKWANIIIASIKHVLKELSLKPTKGVKMLMFSTLLDDTGIGFEAALAVAVELIAFKLYGDVEISRKKCILEEDAMPTLYALKDTIMKIDWKSANISYMKFPDT